MDAKELRELIEVVARNGISTLELEREGFKLRLVKDAAVVLPSGVAAEAPALPTGLPEAEARGGTPLAAPADDGLVILHSPIVGTFYRASSPDSPPFVEAGESVRKGQVLCIVEAMKLMNEIESDVDADVVEIYPANGQPVEYGEALFKLRPLA